MYSRMWNMELNILFLKVNIFPNKALETLRPFSEIKHMFVNPNFEAFYPVTDLKHCIFRMFFQYLKLNIRFWIAVSTCLTYS
jgi:hypothetical protein